MVNSLSDNLLHQARVLADILKHKIQHFSLPVVPDNWEDDLNFKSECQEYLENLESDSRSFVESLARVIEESQQEHEILEDVQNTFSIFADVISLQQSRNLSRSCICLYPLLLIFYTFFVVATRKRYAPLINQFRNINFAISGSNPIVPYESIQKPLLWILYPLISLAPDTRCFVLEAALRDNQFYHVQLDLIKRIRQTMFSWLSLQNSDFWRGEFILSLVTIGLKHQSFNELWSPQLQREWRMASPPLFDYIGLYLVEPHAHSVLTSFLRESSTWLSGLYPNIRELLIVFDEQVQQITEKLEEKGYSKGFCGGAVEAFQSG